MLFEIKFDAMTSFYDNYDYYKKMLQLQERLRKSEEERIRLEERFKMLMQESRNRHYTCISRLRLRYIEFLEEQRTKNDRNHKFLETLNNVDNSLVLMSAKINRLNVLKEQYENYHRQIYAIRNSPENTNNGIDKMKEIKNRNSQENVNVKHLSPEVKRRPSPQMIWLDYQINSSISSSASNLTSEAKDGPKHNTQFKPLNQQISHNQNMFQIPQQNNTQSVPLHNLSSQYLQYKPPYQQIDSDLYVLQTLSNSPVDSLSKQSGTYLSESPKRMQTIQVQPRCINTDVSRYKLLDVSENQARLGNTQSYINPTVTTHSYRPEHRKISLNDAPLRIRNINKTLENYRPASMIIKRNVPNISLSRSNLPKHHYQSYLNYPLRNVNRLHPSVSDIRTSTLMTSNDEHFTLKDLDNIRISQECEKALIPESESRIAMAVENELDKYIANIDKLHREHNVQNLKKMNRGENKNTSADDDQQISTEIQSNKDEVLASAGDLASKTIDLNDATNIPVSEESQAVCEERETSVVVKKDKISKHSKLDSCEDTEKSEKQLPKSQEDQNIDSAIVSNDKFMEQDDNKHVIEENFYREKPSKERGVFVSKESQLDHCSFETAEALKPWNLDSVQKQIMEAKLTKENKKESGEHNIIRKVSELNEDNVKEAEEGNEVTTAENQMEKQDFEKDINIEEMNNQNNDHVELKEDTVNNYETEIRDIPNLVDTKVEEVQYDANNENIPENPELENYTFEEHKEINNAQTEECNGTNQSNTEEYNDQNCIAESSRADHFEAEQFNFNEEYSYNQNTSYEDNDNLNYDQNVSSHDNQQQEHQEHQEYVQESNQYEHDYNVQSQENLDQQNACYQQSDPNQVGETNVDQFYEYTDYNQSEIMQKDEDKEDKHEQPQQEMKDISDEINASQNKNTKVLAGNESNPKKDVIKSLLDSDTDTTIERNVSNTESDFDFN